MYLLSGKGDEKVPNEDFSKETKEADSEPEGEISIHVLTGIIIHHIIMIRGILIDIEIAKQAGCSIL